jgi:uncharacterized protein (DUF2267 family)
MRYDELIKRVSEETGLERDQADAAMRAVLRTLTERIGTDEADDLAAQLPKELKDAVPPLTAPERFDAEEFVRRVAGLADVPLEEARRIIQGVFAVIRQAVSDGELADIHDRLPKDIDWLLLGWAPPERSATGSAARAGEL